jgi:pyruvate kinase
VTIGPSLQDEKTLSEILAMNVSWVRFNMSHGTYDEHRLYHSLVMKVADELGKNIKCFADLQGPKIRIGKLIKEPLQLLEGSLLLLTSDIVTGTAERISVDYKDIQKLVTTGSDIYIHDGAIALTVLDNNPQGVLCKITQGGEIQSHQGVNIPDALLPLEAITEKDRADLTFALQELNVDGIALSFVRTKEDILELKKLIPFDSISKAIISKIETRLALHNIKEIIEHSDIIMLARGDLGIEIPATKIPLTQKEICLVADANSKPVIIATQILTSMVTKEVPTRAEVTDAIDGLVDGATFLMLSDETTIGSHPVKAVRILNDCILEFTSNRGKYEIFEH